MNPADLNRFAYLRITTNQLDKPIQLRVDALQLRDVTQCSGDIIEIAVLAVTDREARKNTRCLQMPLHAHKVKPANKPVFITGTDKTGLQTKLCITLGPFEYFFPLPRPNPKGKIDWMPYLLSLIF